MTRSALVDHLMRRYSHCRFFLLSTDHGSSPEGNLNHAFHRSLGFLSYEEKEMPGFGLPRNRPDLRDTAPWVKDLEELWGVIGGGSSCGVVRIRLGRRAAA